MRDKATKISGSLRMREPVELAGPWTATVGRQGCLVRLTHARLEAANGWRIGAGSECLARFIPGAVAWRPSPEGLEIVAGDRRTLVALTANADTSASAELPGGEVLTLRPA